MTLAVVGDKQRVLWEYREGEQVRWVREGFLVEVIHKRQPCRALQAQDEYRLFLGEEINGKGKTYGGKYTTEEV